MAVGSGGLPDWKIKIEVPHNTVHRMIIICVVGFVKDEEADLST